MNAKRAFRFGAAADGAPSRTEWTALARRAEELGYSTFLVPDHFVTEFPPIAALMAAADATTTLRVGSLVFDNDFRHPALLAKEVAALDLLSGGRMELGIGAGWHRDEYEQVGLAFDSANVRIERLSEAITIIKRFFTDESVTFAGTHYRVRNLQGIPKPIQQPHPPLFIGGGGRRLLSLAAREADIVGLHFKVNGDSTVDADERTESALERKIRWVREAAGERFASLELSLLVGAVTVTEDRERAAVGHTQQLAQQLGSAAPTASQILSDPYMFIGSLDELVGQARRLREQLGISYIVLRPDDVEAFAPVVARLSGA